MKCRILLFISILASTSISNAQKQDKNPDPDPDEDNEDEPIELDPSAAPIRSFDPTITIFDFVDTDSTEPSESPIAVSFDSKEPSSFPTVSMPSSFPIPSPSLAPSVPPFSTAPSVPPFSTAPSVPPFSTAPSVPTFSTAPSVPTLPPTPSEDCANQPCDIDDSDACSCRAALECRQRSIGQFLCSQVPRTERTRLSDTDGIGGAAGRDRRGRNPT